VLCRASLLRKLGRRGRIVLYAIVRGSGRRVRRRRPDQRVRL